MTSLAPSGVQEPAADLTCSGEVPGPKTTREMNLGRLLEMLE